MKAMAVVCGEIRACRVLALGKLEVTVCGDRGKERLLDGFKVRNTRIVAKELCNDELVVSFLNLPAYISDEEISDKLCGWGVRALSPIKRRMWPGTNIADGTRIVRVKFNELVQSLPYSTKFNTATGSEYFRVIHDRQMKVCRNCMQPGHILRECPDFTCHNCGSQGHYARECATVVARCRTCRRRERDCVCPAVEEVEEDSDGSGESDSSGGGEEKEEDEDGEKEEMEVSRDRDSISGGEESPTFVGEELTSSQLEAWSLPGGQSGALPQRQRDTGAKSGGGQRDGVRVEGVGWGENCAKENNNVEVREAGEDTRRGGSSGSDMDFEKELVRAQKRVSLNQKKVGNRKKKK